MRYEIRIGNKHTISGDQEHEMVEIVLRPDAGPVRLVLLPDQGLPARVVDIELYQGINVPHAELNATGDIDEHGSVTRTLLRMNKRRMT